MAADPLLVGVVSAGVASLVTGVFAWLQTRTKATTSSPAEMAASLAAFQAALNSAAEGVVASLRLEIADLKSRIEELEGENRQMKQMNGSLLSVLKRKGVDVSKVTADGAYTVVDGDEVTVTPSPRPALPPGRPS